ncbi:hypothetical protein NQ317_000685 [Molorchus minor]|uniref:Uncharacterized protein n=1 Tax=Molorchus minor TaxID=1323400 RepID=A0ABQ9JIP1_9CUCU|nr:hypothetical protein NQ317_000685 [Molorchus minor]
MIVYDNIDISKYAKLMTFLKRNSDANEDEYLMIKIALIFGISGACRGDELTNLRVDDIKDVVSSLITIPNTKTQIAVIIRCADQRAQLDPAVAKVSMYLRMYKVKRKKIDIDEETSHLREQGDRKVNVPSLKNMGPPAGPSIYFFKEGTFTFLSPLFS